MHHRFPNCALLPHHFVDLQSDPNPPCFVRAAVVLRALTAICVFYQIFCAFCELFFLCFSVEMLLLIDILCFLDSNMPHDLLCFNFATANCLSESSTVLSFLSTFPSFLCVALTQVVVISSITRSSVMSVFPDSLYNSVVRLSIVCLCVDTRAVFLSAHLDLRLHNEFARLPRRLSRSLLILVKRSATRSKKSSWIVGALGATSDDLSYKIV